MNAASAECYVAQVIALLSDYPPEVIAELARPVTGIVGKTKWLPAVFEIKELADRLMWIPRRMVEDRDAELKQISDREKPINPVERLALADHAAAVVSRLRGK